MTTSGGANSKLGSPIGFLEGQRKGFAKLRLLLQKRHSTDNSFFSEKQKFCFHVPVLNIHIAATQHDGDVFTRSFQISMPVRHVLIGNSRS